MWEGLLFFVALGESFLKQEPLNPHVKRQLEFL